MNLKRRISKHLFGQARRKRSKRYWLLIWLVSTFAACDVLLLFLLTKIFLPLLTDTTPYLLPEQAQDYAHLSTFTAPRKPVTAVAFTPDGKTLACAAYNEIILWDVKTGDPQYTMKEHEGIVTALTFSPDGKTFASSSKSKQFPVLLCDTVTGQVKTSLSGHTSWIATLDFSLDSDTLVGANDSGLIPAQVLHTNKHLEHLRLRASYMGITTENASSPDGIGMHRLRTLGTHQRVCILF